MHLFLLIFSFVISGCFAKSFDPANPEVSFAAARESFAERDYELAITRLGSFKSRFPYSKLTAEAELLIADALYALARYPEALLAYQRFVRLRPRHRRRPYAMFQIGQSHWIEAPAAVDREQNYTYQALAAWRDLLTAYPASAEAEKAQQLIEQGERRIASSFIFIADFYCAQGIYHSCAWRHIELAKQWTRFADLATASRHKAAAALEKVLAQKKTSPSDSPNVLLKNYSRAELSTLITELRQ